MKEKAHLSDELIVRSLDGELASSEAAKVREHIEACWSCRAQREQIKQIINSVAEYQHHDPLVRQFLPRPKSSRAMFIAQLNQAIECAAQPSLGSSIVRSLWSNRWPVGIA